MATDNDTVKQKLAKLEPPGAGVPWPQRMVMRYILSPFVAGRSDWAQNQQVFTTTSLEILQLLESLDDWHIQKRVMVPPQTGLEDSSRYWSAVMVAEHLMIVGMGMRDIIVRLSQGKVPPGKVDTARVKPIGGRTPEQVMESYKQFITTLMSQIDTAVQDRDSKTVYDHPWFGPFTARQWHWVLAQHNVIHLKQLRRIVAGLQTKQV